MKIKLVLKLVEESLENLCHWRAVDCLEGTEWKPSVGFFFKKTETFGEAFWRRWKEDSYDYHYKKQEETIQKLQTAAIFFQEQGETEMTLTNTEAVSLA